MALAGMNPKTLQYLMGHSEIGVTLDVYTHTSFENAKDEIIIIDNYIDRTVLDRLIVKRKDVNVTIYTSINSKLLGNDIKLFNKQYGNLEVKYTTKVHDRIANVFALL